MFLEAVDLLEVTEIQVRDLQNYRIGHIVNKIRRKLGNENSNGTYSQTSIQFVLYKLYVFVQSSCASSSSSLGGAIWPQPTRRWK